MKMKTNIRYKGVFAKTNECIVYQNSNRKREK